jgi:hypothetical protein
MATSGWMQAGKYPIARIDLFQVPVARFTEEIGIRVLQIAAPRTAGLCPKRKLDRCRNVLLGIQESTNYLSVHRV